MISPKPNGRRTSSPGNPRFGAAAGPAAAMSGRDANPTPDVVRPHRDAVTAAHDAIAFARALVSEGGHSTAGLTMLRTELQQLACELRAGRAECAALRQDVESLRLDVLRLSAWCHGPLVARLAVRFEAIDAALASRSA